jgi:hypothetical protein
VEPLAFQPPFIARTAGQYPDLDVVLHIRQAQHCGDDGHGHDAHLTSPEKEQRNAHSPSLVEASNNKDAKEKLNCQMSSVAGRAQLSEELGCHQCMGVLVGEDI